MKRRDRGRAPIARGVRIAIACYGTDYSLPANQRRRERDQEAAEQNSLTQSPIQPLHLSCSPSDEVSRDDPAPRVISKNRASRISRVAGFGNPRKSLPPRGF